MCHELQKALPVFIAWIFRSESSTSRSHAGMLLLNTNPRHSSVSFVRNQMTTQAWSRPGRSTGKPSQTFWAIFKIVPKVNPFASCTETQIPLCRLCMPPHFGCWMCNCATLMRGSVTCMPSQVGRIVSDDVLGIANDAL